MTSEFVTTRTVEFAETDMAGIAHFSNFFRWMESAEHAFFRSLGLSVHGELDGRGYGFARVHATCDYRRPVRYEDELEVRLAVTKKTSKALGYDFEFRILPGADDPPIATGRLEVVCVTASGDGAVRAMDIPDPISRALTLAPQA